MAISIASPPFDKKHASLTDVSTPHEPADINQAAKWNFSNTSSSFAGVVSSTADVSNRALITGGTIASGTIDQTATYNFTSASGTFAGYASKAGDADTVDTKHYSDISAEIDSDISAGTIGGGTIDASYAYNFTNSSSSFSAGLQIGGNVNLNDNQILNLIVHSGTSFPTFKIGKLFFRTDLGKLYVGVRTGDTWTTCSTMPTARRSLVAAVANNGTIYCIGGYDDHFLATNEAYDPNTDTW